MRETYNSVLDRMGAFNAATESMSKGRTAEFRMTVRGGPTLRLVRTAENYSIELTGVPAEASEAVAAMGFTAGSDGSTRAVSKAERSWAVASQLEDILQEALKLPPEVSVSIETLQ